MKQARFWQPLYEDDDLIAVNKASGISVTGDRWAKDRDRLDLLLAREAGLPKLFVVHRIDNGTSGVIIFAKNAPAHKRLSELFARRGVEKKYKVVVHGRPAWQETVCTIPLLPDANKKHLTIEEHYRGKKSITRFTVLGGAGGYSVLQAAPETGRQHQIRVHLARLGHPVVCDDLYGDGKPVYLSAFKRNWRGDRLLEKPLLARLGLHAESLTIPNLAPLYAPLSKDINALITQIMKISS